ncbi:MAG TPA: hypothetical protein VE569_06270 [Acidimicrobiia bacterium]|nr:hypothetical protein [Acidimicrobiia bacterium]
MFAHDLHVLLAWTTLAALLVGIIEAGVRTTRGNAPGKLAGASLNAVLILVGMAAAAGLAILVRGGRPEEWLHFVYAILAFGLVPVADHYVADRPARLQGLTRLGGGLVALVVVVRLFVTG